MASSPARAVGHQAPPALVALPADLSAHLAAAVVADVAAGDPVRTSSLVTALAAVPDPRHRRGRRHQLTGLLAIGACACLTGSSSYVAIGEWAAAQGRAVLDCLGSDADLPSESTLRRCLQDTDAAALDAAVAGWAGQQLAVQQAWAAGTTHPPITADRRVIAIDGKTLRGSAPRSAPGDPHERQGRHRQQDRRLPNRGYGASAGATPAGDNDHHRSRPPARRRSAEPARLLGEDTLARCRRVLGPDHPTTLNAATGLTLALVQLGETEPARTLGED